MVPKELTGLRQVWTETEGLPSDNNHDPSNIVYSGGMYHLWITQHMREKPYNSFRNCKIMLTRSEDGYHWTPPEDALLPSREGWDSGGVLTANVTEWEGLYYLFYTGVDPQFDVTHSRRYAGYGVSESPLGPWKRGAEPLLGPGGKGFDEDSADDVTVFYKDGKFRMYYKGSYPGLDGNHTEIGVAFSDSITGPYRRYEGNPIMPGHAFAIWPYAGGYLYLSGRKDTNEGTVYNDDPEWKDPRGRQSLFWSEDGLAFEPCCPFENRAPGIYAGSTTDLTKCWGVSVKTRNGSMGRYIARFDFRL